MFPSLQSPMDARTVKAACLHQPWSGDVLPTLLVDKLSQWLVMYTFAVEPISLVLHFSTDFRDSWPLWKSGAKCIHHLKMPEEMRLQCMVCLSV